MSRSQPPCARDLVDEFLERSSLPTSDAHPCPYLPDREMINEGFACRELPSWVYRELLDRNFRRSGRSFYRPGCPTCRECQQIRVPVRTFRLSRSQRRTWRRNRDLSVKINRHPIPTEEKWSIFKRYVHQRHDDVMSTAYDDFVDFLYDSPIRTIEIEYRIGGAIAAVSILDRCPGVLSSVYVYFEPTLAWRGPGHFTALWEIEYCRRTGYDYYYLGYHIRGCEKMEYKSRYQPCELLVDRSVWVSGTVDIAS